MEQAERWRERATFLVVLAGAFAIPLVVAPDPIDMFRLPKDLVFRAEAILLVSLTLGAWILGAPLPRLDFRTPWFWLGATAIAWLGVITLTSTNRAISIESSGTVVAAIVIFLATRSAARRHAPMLLGAALTAAAINALLVLVEEANLWMPFGVRGDISHHLQSSALLGNPNEIGGYLGAATLACIAAYAARRSAWTLAGALLLTAALLASQTMTALIAFVVASLTMLATISWRKAILAAVPAAVILILLFFAITPLRQRVMRMTQSLRAGDYNSAVTERFTPFVAAWSMIVDHPLTGVGPGAFAWEFYDYKIRAEKRFPSLRSAYNRGLNFGEVHNDHLQVLAETGIGGYGAFVALLAALAAISFRTARDASDPWIRVAHRLALPLAVFWLVLSLAQFPLHTTVVRALLVHLAALCAAWSRP
jgi:hypothetical protein